LAYSRALRDFAEITEEENVPATDAEQTKEGDKANKADTRNESMR